MATSADVRCRLCLVTPAHFSAGAFAPRLADALAGGDVASLIITSPTDDPSAFQRAVAELVPIANTRGVASVVAGDGRIASRVGADGIHVDSGAEDVAAARESFRKKIVGAGNIQSRHDAMEIAEADPDYLFFGKLDGDSGDEIFPRALELASWWSSVAVIPAIVMGGSSVASVDAAATNGIEFVALSRAVWEHPRGPAAAVAEASARLAELAREPAA
jgi:thiamine-phosphate pyrophosphorylase